MKMPEIHPTVFVTPNATVMGDIVIGAESSVFFGAVLRAEHAPVVIGQRTNIQDNCVLHNDLDYPLIVGDDCTVGHGVILHGCTVGDNTLIGMGAIVLNGAVIGRDCIIGAGALVPQGAVIPDGSLVVGMPGKVRREVTEEEIAENLASAGRYVVKARDYMAYLAGR